MSILVFQHHDIGLPGRLGATLRDNGHRLRIIRPDRGEPLPPDLDGVSGVVSLGGPQNIDEHRTNPNRWPWLDREMAILREAHERSLPVVGVCLGHQMLAAALGGEVAPMPRAQLGFHGVTLTPAAHTDTVFAGIAWQSKQFCVNGREVTRLPQGAVALASSPLCKVMAFRAGMRSYGFQYHFECDRPLVERYLAEEPGGFAAAALEVGGVGAQVAREYDSFARLADRLCDNLAMYLFRPRFRERVRRNMPEGSAAVSGAR